MNTKTLTYTAMPSDHIIFSFLKVYCSERKPKIFIHGDWIGRAGFEIDTLITAYFRHGEAIFILPFHDMEENINQTHKDAALLLRVRSCISKRGTTVPLICMKGLWLADYGFSIGMPIIVMLEYGAITMKTLKTYEHQNETGGNTWEQDY